MQTFNKNRASYLKYKNIKSEKTCFDIHIPPGPGPGILLPLTKTAPVPAHAENGQRCARKPA